LSQLPPRQHSTWAGPKLDVHLGLAAKKPPFLLPAWQDRIAKLYDEAVNGKKDN
jgi:hypothetical protein